jgi:glycosyltransferase involved in cell wall biosynthesis
MRILHIIPYFYPAWAYGGTCRAAWELARATARQGHDVIAYTTDALDSRRRAGPPFEVVDGVVIHRFPNLSNRLAWGRLFLPLTFGSKLEEAIREADVVHLHEYRSLQDAMALPILTRLRKPYIITAQGGVPLLVGRFALKRVYDSWVGRKLIARATRLHALNTMEREQFLQAGGRPDQIFIAPNGLHVGEFKTLPPADEFRAKYGIPHDAPLVLFLARVHKIKGPDFLMAAFAELKRTLSDSVLVIAGPDDGFLPEVKRQAAALGIESAVRFIDYLDGAAKLEAYQAADVYVLPSAYEILGITLLEALACRTPVITTDRCGLKEVVAENNLGEVVKFGDASAMKSALLQMLNERGKTDRGREYVLSNFGWDKIAARWEAVYQQCAADRRLEIGN